jgi:hypothetical protein
MGRQSQTQNASQRTASPRAVSPFPDPRLVSVLAPVFVSVLAPVFA